jgi:hypothetical protein
MEESVNATAQAGAMAFFTGHGHNHKTPQFDDSRPVYDFNGGYSGATSGDVTWQGFFVVRIGKTSKGILAMDVGSFCSYRGLQDKRLTTENNVFSCRFNSFTKL